MKSVLYLILLLFFTTAFAQTDKTIDDFEKIKVERLKRIRREMIQVESKIFNHKKKINSDQDMVNKLKLESELLDFQNQYDKKSIQFIETATGLTFSTEKQTKVEKKDLLQDVQELLGPALKGIKKASERPRQIQKLEEDLQDVVRRLDENTRAHAKLDELIKDSEHKELKRAIRNSIKIISDTEKKVKNSKRRY